MKFDVLALILDDNSAFVKNGIAFRSIISDFTHRDSIVVIISANNSVNRIVAGIDPKSISSFPSFSGTKTKANDIKEVMSWIIEAQCTREIEGKSAKTIGVLVDCDTFKHRMLILKLKAENGITVVEAITPKQVTLMPSMNDQRRKTWRDFKSAFVGTAIISLIIGILLGGTWFHLIDEKYPTFIATETSTPVAIEAQKEKPIIVGDSANEIIDHNYKENQEAVKESSNRQEEVTKNMSTTPVALEGEYILPFSSNRKITLEDIKDLNNQKLGIARNEIYARHGYIFETDKYRDYFMNKSWYRPNSSFSESQLNEIEKYNIEFIMKYE